MSVPLLSDLAIVARWLIAGFFAATVIAIVLRAGYGGDMLRPRRGSRIDVRRLQSAGITLIFAIAYAVAALARDPARGMPHVPGVLLMVLTGSQATYLWGKFATRNT